MEARVRAYWWWLNGNVTKESITRDLEQLKAKGWGGALICDAGGAEQDGNAQVPHGPTFFTPEWRALYRHALAEAHRLGLELSLNIQSGWNLGGPMVKPEDAPKKLVWTEQRVSGPGRVEIRLEQPKGRDGFYQDLFVLALPVKEREAGAAGAEDHAPKPIRNLAQKALLKPLVPFSAPSSAPLFEGWPATPGEEDLEAGQVLNLTGALGPDGRLNWQTPASNWVIIRFGCTLNDHCHVSTCSDGWQGYAIDPFDAAAFQRYWRAVVEPLIADAGNLAGSTLKYLHTDSWEVEVANWTPTLRQDFLARRGYDLLPWLPVITGRIVNSREQSNRFLYDFRRTIGDLAIDHHYSLFRDGAHRHGLQIHPESGGPHAVPIDAQQCLGMDDAPMSEFWAWSWRHRVGDANRFFVKQPASAAHTCGRRLVLAEGFTTIGPHWQETLWDNLKPSFDHACLEGLNRLVWHAFVCSPESAGLPGQQYFAGTHMNPEVTWWQESGPFITYLNRCQFLLQQGLPVSDVLYFYGDHVPNFTQLRASDPARVGPGFDYDVIAADALLKRVSVKNGHLVLPDGVTYRLLVMADLPVMSLPVLKKVQSLAAAGATVVMGRPEHTPGLGDYPKADRELAGITQRLFRDAAPSNSALHRYHGGRIFSGVTARQVLDADGVAPDFACAADGNPDINFIHRRDGQTEIYFVASRSTNTASARLSFRVTGKTPELWDPVTGQHRFAAAYTQSAGTTTLPCTFPPCGSLFVIFREPAAEHPPTANSNDETFSTLAKLAGPWSVSFDPKYGPTQPVSFDTLQSWSDRPEPLIRFFSGTAVYRKEFDFDPAQTDQRTHREAGGARPKGLFLDLGVVRELAEVKLNGISCGVTWSPPFRVDISKAVRPGTNTLEIEVVNFWPNRLTGDASLPPAQRTTRTNIRKFRPNTPLMPSGLLGPVSLLQKALTP